MDVASTPFEPPRANDKRAPSGSDARKSAVDDVNPELAEMLRQQTHTGQFTLGGLVDTLEAWTLSCCHWEFERLRGTKKCFLIINSSLLAIRWQLSYKQHHFPAWNPSPCLPPSSTWSPW